MAMNEPQAEGAAKELMIAMAQSGLLKVRGASATQRIEDATRYGQWDAAYISTLYRNLVAEFQKD